MVEYRSKDGAGRFHKWTVLDYYIPFKSLHLKVFYIRINGEVFSSHDDVGFKEKFNNAMFWIRLKS